MARDSAIQARRVEGRGGPRRSALKMRDDIGPGPVTHESAAWAPKIRQRLTVAALLGHLELARRPDLYGTPVIVGRWDEHVVAASEETLPYGVVPGIAPPPPEHLGPQATFVLPGEESTARIPERTSSAPEDLAPAVDGVCADI